MAGKDNQSEDITEELDTSYQQKNSGNVRSAFLYGLSALVVTLIVSVAVFYGGRAVYRTLTSDDNGETTEQAPAGDTGGTQEGAGPAPDEQTGQPGGGGESPQESTGSEAPASDMPSTGDQAENLPSTGDEGL